MTSERIIGRDIASGASVQITVAAGYITGIEPAFADPDDDFWLAPGLVDLQVNGYGGHDLNAERLEHETVTKIAEAMLAVGVTRFIPTIITNSEQAITANLKVIAEARAASSLLQSMIPYAHVEGPHISVRDGPRGAHSALWVRQADLEEFARWQRASDGLVGMVTVSPHDDAALNYIAGVSAQGIHVAIGHSDTTPQQIHNAADAGAVLSTHLGNGVASVLARHPNLLWAQLADDRLSATFIGDGHHLDPVALRAMIRAKGTDRSILVSDAVALAGLTPGDYTTPIGGRVTLSASGRLDLADTSFLAGAAVPLKDCVAKVVRDAGIPLSDAIRMATVNPARFAGGGGELTIGARADIIRFRLDPAGDGIVIHDVWLSGTSTNISEPYEHLLNHSGADIAALWRDLMVHHRGKPGG